jgi:hypothetical protein
MFTIEQPGEYRTRDGRKVVVLGYNPHGSQYRRWIGYMGEQTSEWADDCSYQPGGASDRDIVGPWEHQATIGRLAETYFGQRDLPHPEVTLEYVLRAIAAEIDALKGASGEWGRHRRVRCGRHFPRERGDEVADALREIIIARVS